MKTDGKQGGNKEPGSAKIPLERLVNYGAMNRLHQENQKREVIVGELFNTSRDSPLIRSHITAWEAGGYLTFEQMIVKLVLALHDENERLRGMVINDLNMRTNPTAILK